MSVESNPGLLWYKFYKFTIRSMNGDKIRVTCSSNQMQKQNSRVFPLLVPVTCTVIYFKFSLVRCVV